MYIRTSAVVGTAEVVDDDSDEGYRHTPVDQHWRIAQAEVEQVGQRRTPLRVRIQVVVIATIQDGLIAAAAAGDVGSNDSDRSTLENGEATAQRNARLRQKGAERHVEPDWVAMKLYRGNTIGFVVWFGSALDPGSGLGPVLVIG